jgi:hypothetical protein
MKSVIALAALVLFFLIMVVLVVLDHGRTILIPTGDGGLVPVPTTLGE